MKLPKQVDERLKEYICNWNPNYFMGYDSFREYIITFIANELRNRNKEIWRWCQDNSFEIEACGYKEIRVVDCDGLGELLNKLDE
jgi:hypothetical protein